MKDPRRLLLLLALPTIACTGEIAPNNTQTTGSGGNAATTAVASSGSTDPTSANGSTGSGSATSGGTSSAGSGGSGTSSAAVGSGGGATSSSVGSGGSGSTTASSTTASSTATTGVGGTNPDWSNEPPGSRVLLDNSLDSKVTGQCQDVYPGSYAEIIQDPTAPYSGPNVLRNYKPANQGQGGSLIYCTFEAVSQVFVGMWFKASNPFGGYPHGGNKLTGYIGQEYGNFIGMAYHGAYPNERVVAPWFNGGSNFGWGDNCHIPQVYTPIADECKGVSYNLYGNVNEKPLTDGEWHKLEWYMSLSSSASSRDGVVKWWVDDELQGDHENFNSAQSLFNNWGLTHTWDGQCSNYGPWDLSPWMPGTTSPNACVPWEDSWYIDHMYVSTTQ